MLFNEEGELSVATVGQGWTRWRGCMASIAVGVVALSSVTRSDKIDTIRNLRRVRI
jgi:hypothetical protein